MWGTTVEWSAVVQATSREVGAQSRTLKVRARRARQRICGGSDPDRAGLAVLVVSVILERPTCLTCIAEKVGAAALAVERTIEEIGRTVNIQLSNAERCRMCGSTLGPTYSLPR